MIKTTVQARPSSTETTRLLYCRYLYARFYAYEIAHGAKPTLRPHLRRLSDGRMALILADSGCQQLRRIIDEEKRLGDLFTLTAVERALRHTLDIATKLHTLHSVGLVHKSMCPSTILLERETHAAELLDLTSASLLLIDKVEPDQSLLSHTPMQWRYLSPEQSGRANRVVDQRSDLYSLGVVLYELLTGHPPFCSQDPMELIHQHLARAPPPILPKVMRKEETDPIVFAAIEVASAIANKLLRKSADERYQSTSGLLSDLRAVLAMIEQRETDRLAEFVIGQLDFASVFRLSQTLYGREEEIAALVRVHRGVSRLLSPDSASPGEKPDDETTSRTPEPYIDASSEPPSTEFEKAAPSTDEHRAPASSGAKSAKHDPSSMGVPQLFFIRGPPGAGSQCAHA